MDFHDYLRSKQFFQESRINIMKSSNNSFPGDYGDRLLAVKNAELQLEASESGSSKHE